MTQFNGQRNRNVYEFFIEQGEELFEGIDVCGTNLSSLVVDTSACIDQIR
jgi:hypothetical protein